MTHLPALRRYRQSRALAIVQLLDVVLRIVGVAVAALIIVGSAMERQRFDLQHLPAQAHNTLRKTT